jgi:hypothetical protein
MPWERVSYVVEPSEGPAVSDLLAAFRGVYLDGSVLFRAFRAVDDQEFDRARRLDFRSLDQTFRTILTRPSVVAALPELQIPDPIEPPPEFRQMSAFGMEGELTALLLAGGASRRFAGTVDEARGLTRRFMESLLGDHLGQPDWSAGCSSTPWTPWFRDVAWDFTFLLLDQEARRLFLLCMTDTD